jgi:hypothetical protein
VIDDVSLTAAPVDLVAQKQYNNKVPVIIGSTRDEFSFFAILYNYYPANLTERGFDEYYQPEVGSDILAQVKKNYAPAAYPYPSDLGNWSEWWWTAIRFETDKVPGG